MTRCSLAKQSNVYASTLLCCTEQTNGGMDKDDEDQSADDMGYGLRTIKLLVAGRVSKRAGWGDIHGPWLVFN